MKLQQIHMLITIILALTITAAPIESVPILMQAEIKAPAACPPTEIASGITSRKEMPSSGKEMPESAGNKVSDEGKSSKVNFGFGYNNYNPFRRFGYNGLFGFSGLGFPGFSSQYLTPPFAPLPIPALAYAGIPAVFK
jgi:hypothetical protein